MKWFKTSCIVCMQNFRKWPGDIRIIITFALLLIVSHNYGSSFLDYNKMMGSNGIAPWNLIHAFQNVGIKVMYFLPLVFLFSDAPFIDANQPYIISRCTRRSWSFGQVLYIMLGSAAYVVVCLVLSILVIIGNVEWTSEWGLLFDTALKVGSPIPGLSSEVQYYFTPQIALFYTMLLSWMAYAFIGLVIYAVNSATQKTAYGIAVGCFFVILDCACNLVASSNPLKNQWFYYLSPVSWCSVGRINIRGEVTSPGIVYILCAYSVLIVGLSIAAVLMSKKQQINVVQAV